MVPFAVVVVKPQDVILDVCSSPSHCGQWALMSTAQDSHTPIKHRINYYWSSQSLKMIAGAYLDLKSRLEIAKATMTPIRVAAKYMNKGIRRKTHVYLKQLRVKQKNHCMWQCSDLKGLDFWLSVRCTEARNGQHHFLCFIMSSMITCNCVSLLDIPRYLSVHSMQTQRFIPSKYVNIQQNKLENEVWGLSCNELTQAHSKQDGSSAWAHIVCYSTKTRAGFTCTGFSNSI